MKRIAVLLALALTLALAQPLSACTILAAVQDGQVLVANNEDFNYPFNSVWCVPASANEHGRICFGLETGLEELATLGGINDQGLFIDGNGLSNTDWEPVAGRETYNGIVEAHVLAHHATVAEAVEWFRTTNIPIMKRAKFLLADRSGAAG